MLVLRATPKCRALNCSLWHVIKIEIREPRTHFKQCTTLASLSKSDFSSSKRPDLDSVTEGNVDNFGNLRRSLERSKNKQKLQSTKSARIVKVKNRYRPCSPDQSDVFGNLSKQKPVWYPDINEDAKIDNDQHDKSTLVRNISKKFKCPDEYLRRMKKLVAEKKLKEALDLFVEMRRNFVNPIHAHFTFLIGACGRFGFTEMAFKLLKQMTDRDIQPSSATLTGLFNSCGESPFADFGLKKAHLLKEKIASKNWPLNQITYHAMIKAFGRCGDIQTAFQIVDEMTKADIQIDVNTYNFLLMSCISNKEAGFTHAVEVMRKMKEKTCLPNLFSFNLFLRATRECDVGPNEVSCFLLEHWSNYFKRPYGFKIKNSLPQQEILQLQAAKISEDKNIENSESAIGKNVVEDLKHDIISENKSSSVQEVELKNSLINSLRNTKPSVLGSRPLHGTEILDLGQVKTPSDRLMLIGGAVGFLETMRQIEVKPSIKTFTLLLACLPPNTEDEEQLLSLLHEYKVTPDIGFFNVLIKRRHFRFDMVAAHEVLMLINKWSLSPDLITFGVLALGCHNYSQFEKFINDMEKLGCFPNIEIIGSLLHSACCRMDFSYLKGVLNLMEDLEIAPTENMLTRIEKTLENVRKRIIDMEHGKCIQNVYRKEDFSKRYKEFCVIYEQWLKRNKFGKEEHVWDQFRTDIVEKKTNNVCTPLVID